jgi:hypothetical protein
MFGVIWPILADHSRLVAPCAPVAVSAVEPPGGSSQGGAAGTGTGGGGGLGAHPAAAITRPEQRMTNVTLMFMIYPSPYSDLEREKEWRPNE